MSPDPWLIDKVRDIVGLYDRIEVRFASAKEAVVKLFALAQALTVDYERFETIVGKGERSG